jgi:MoaA/NifB/PqqE/SkfB family radical SAM enzyme
MLIASVTDACNLNCRGCYARNHRRRSGLELRTERWREILAEAQELGISIVMVAGGEPFARSGWMDLTAEFPRLLFPVFTNGLLIEQDTVRLFRRRRNCIPVISVDGTKPTTDRRRGDGVHDAAFRAMETLRKNGVFTGVSLTVTRRNADEVTETSFIEQLVRSGCSLFFFVEYIPIESGTEGDVLTPPQKEALSAAAERLRKRYRIECIVFPGDEAQYGGCLAAGRGFIHVGPDGSLEPCPFAPYSDATLSDATLRDALRSDFLKILRDNHHRLAETNGGCALWANREWVRSLLPEPEAAVTVASASTPPQSAKHPSFPFGLTGPMEHPVDS